MCTQSSSAARSANAQLRCSLAACSRKQHARCTHDAPFADRRGLSPCSLSNLTSSAAALLGVPKLPAPDATSPADKGVLQLHQLRQHSPTDRSPQPAVHPVPGGVPPQQVRQAHLLAQLCHDIVCSSSSRAARSRAAAACLDARAGAQQGISHPDSGDCSCQPSVQQTELGRGALKHPTVPQRP